MYDTAGHANVNIESIIIIIIIIIICLIMLTDKTVSYWCENIFFIDLKPLFRHFLPVQRKNLTFRQELFKKKELISEEFQLSELIKALSK